MIAAVEGLARLGSVASVSALYETAPVGGPAQGPYLNAVAVVDTPLGARELLQACLEIEHNRGRERRERWGPRTLDMDVLVYGDAVFDEPGLAVPHPRLAERRFVLEPLAEAWPGAALPDGRRFSDLLLVVADQPVERVPGHMWWMRLDVADVLTTPPVVVSPAEAAALVDRLYGIDGEAQGLEGERDRNFVVMAADGTYSFKIANPGQDPFLLDMQQAALAHLAAIDPGLSVPRPVLTLAGEAVVSCEMDGSLVPVRLQTFLEGDRLPDGHTTPLSRAALAKLLARLDAGLVGFSHPGGRRSDLWDLTQIPALRERTGHLDGERRAVIEMEFDRFERDLLPGLGSLRRQMIHSDANPANLLTGRGDPDSITGIVDFGDLIEGPLAAEVAIAAAYQCLHQRDPAEVVADLTRQYHRHLPLGMDEIAAVPGLVTARLAQSHAMSAWRATLHPENRDYVLIHAEPVWEALVRVRGLGEGWLVRKLAG